MNNNSNIYDKIISPVVTEKSTNLSEQNKIVFKVNKNLNKALIKKNIEKLYKVKIIKVNTVNVKPKNKFVRGKKAIKQGYKKVIITLKKGQSIDLTSGL